LPAKAQKEETQMKHSDLCGDARQAYRESSFKAGNCEALVKHYVGGKTVVAFRGTEKNFSDILTDVAGWPAWYGGLGLCHSGFLDNALAAFPHVCAHLGKGMTKEVWLVGHSKGGAEASIVAALLLKAWPPAARINLVTFGCPGIGGWKLGRILEAANPVHYRNGVDCIPSHPLWTRYPSERVELGEWDFVNRYVDPNDRFLDHRIADYEKAVKAHEAASLAAVGIPAPA